MERGVAERIVAENGYDPRDLDHSGRHGLEDVARRATERLRDRVAWS